MAELLHTLRELDQVVKKNGFAELGLSDLSST
jgi:hypothetical protein